MRDESSPRDKLLAIAASPTPKYVAVSELVTLGLVTVADIAALRRAGLQFYAMEDLPDHAPKVWVAARDFVRAAAIVAGSVSDGGSASVH